MWAHLPHWTLLSVRAADVGGFWSSNAPRAASPPPPHPASLPPPDDSAFFSQIFSIPILDPSIWHPVYKTIQALNDELWLRFKLKRRNGGNIKVRGGGEGGGCLISFQLFTSIRIEWAGCFKAHSTLKYLCLIGSLGADWTHRPASGQEFWNYIKKLTWQKLFHSSVTSPPTLNILSHTKHQRYLRNNETRVMSCQELLLCCNQSPWKCFSSRFRQSTVNF